MLFPITGVTHRHKIKNGGKIIQQLILQSEIKKEKNSPMVRTIKKSVWITSGQNVKPKILILKHCKPEAGKVKHP